MVSINLVGMMNSTETMPFIIDCRKYSTVVTRVPVSQRLALEEH